LATHLSRFISATARMKIGPAGSGGLFVHGDVLQRYAVALAVRFVRMGEFALAHALM
jgi:hypothetical protein